MITAFKEARIPGHLIYAFDRSGMILTEPTYDAATPDIKRDWDRAIAEWSGMSRPARRRYLRTAPHG